MSMRKIYISGAITGVDNYLEKFNDAENYIHSVYDLDVINPARVNSALPESTTYDEYMELSICMLSMCDAIYLLTNWADSHGAQVEYKYAVDHSYDIIYEGDI